MMTVRPQGARVISYAISVILVVMTVVIGRALPSSIEFTTLELLTLLVILVVTIGLLHAIGRSVVRADEHGIEIVNGFRRHWLTWDQVAGVSMRAGAPWPTLVTTDDVRIILFAIQRTDGQASEQAVARIRAWSA